VPIPGTKSYKKVYNFFAKLLIPINFSYSLQTDPEIVVELFCDCHHMVAVFMIAKGMVSKNHIPGYY